MQLFRLSKSLFSNDLSGKGAELTGGRWNSKGVAMIYCSASRALCVTEIAVRVPLGILPTDYKLITLEIPDNIPVTELKNDQLPADWKSIPHSASTQEMGDRFIVANKYLILKVPSVVVQGDFNYLINPGHKEMRKVRIVNTETFSFDDRIYRK